MPILLPVARLPDTANSFSCSFCCQLLECPKQPRVATAAHQQISRTAKIGHSCLLASQEWPQLLTSKVDKVEAGELDSGAAIFCALGAGLHDAGEHRMGAARFPVQVGLPNAPVLCPLAHHIQSILHCSHTVTAHAHMSQTHLQCLQHDCTYLVGYLGSPVRYLASHCIDAENSSPLFSFLVR